MNYTNDQVVNAYVRRIAKSKWEMINQTDQGIQIKKVRKFNMLGFWVGLCLLPFWGIGLVFWLLAITDYYLQFLQGDKIKFVTFSQMVRQLKAAK